MFKCVVRQLGGGWRVKQAVRMSWSGMSGILSLCQEVPSGASVENSVKSAVWNSHQPQGGQFEFWLAYIKD